MIIMTTLEERKQEALKRLNFLHKKGMKLTEPIKWFEKGEIAIFEYQNRIFNSIQYGLYMNKSQEDYQKMIKVKEQLESKNRTVYLILVNNTEFGKQASYFYVSNEKNEWEYDFEDLGYKQPICYVANLNHNDGEFGGIEFEYSPNCGGIYRNA